MKGKLSRKLFCGRRDFLNENEERWNLLKNSPWLEIMISAIDHKHEFSSKRAHVKTYVVVMLVHVPHFLSHSLKEREKYSKSLQSMNKRLFLLFLLLCNAGCCCELSYEKNFLYAMELLEVGCRIEMERAHVKGSFSLHNLEVPKFYNTNEILSRSLLF